jgi:hypothetical protein
MHHDKRGIDFVRNHIKGKIAELIFQHMFAESDFATVIPFGYESVTPSLAQYQHLIETQDVLDEIRHMPDFILVKPDQTQLVFVQVKYRRAMERARVLSMAKAMQRRWQTGWLFLATLDAFYMAPCSAIVEAGGQIAPLLPRWIPKAVQLQYLELLREFER